MTTQTEDTNDTTNAGTVDPNSLDGILDSFMQETDRGTSNAAPVADQTKQVEGDKPAPQDAGTQSPNTTATTKPNAGQPEPNADNQGATQTQSNQSLPAAARKYGDLFWQDPKGNIFDAAGTLIAPSGNPHKLFRRLWGHIEKAQLEATGYRNRIEAYDNANAAARAAGLTSDEYAASISLMTAFKKDPKAAVQFLLQQAVERGTDVSDIVQGGGGLNASTLRQAVQEVVTQALEPYKFIIDQRQQEQQQSEYQEQAQQEYQSFIQEYPDAVPHQAHIATVMEKSGKTMVESFFLLKTWALQNGLDWTKPLGEQVEARRSNKGGEPNGGGQNHRLPDFNGRNSDSHVTHDRRTPSADDSWDSIIQSATREVLNRQPRN